MSAITTHALPFPPSTAPRSKPSPPTPAQIPRKPRQNCEPPCGGNSPNSTSRKTDTSTCSVTPIGRNRNSRPGCATSATTSSESPGNSKKPPTPSSPDAPSSPPHSTCPTGHAICTTPPRPQTTQQNDLRPALRRHAPHTPTHRHNRRSPRALRQPHARHPDHKHRPTHARPSEHHTRPPRRRPNHLGGLLASTLTGQSASEAAEVDLTCQHKNHTLLVEGPEITIRPVGTRCMTGGSR